MTINFLTNGTRGDIQPLIYLGEELKRRGHKVRITAGDNFRELITSAGLEHASMPVNLQDYMANPEGRDMIKKVSSNPVSYIREMKKLMKKFSRDTLDSYWQSSQDADLLITTTGALGDVIMGEKLEIPLVEVQLQPLYPSGLYSYPLLPFSLPTPALRKVSYYLMEVMLNSVFKGELKSWQKETFGSVLTYRGGIFAQRRRGADGILGAYSPELIERPAEWPERVQICGFFRPGQNDDGEELAPEISSFLKKGKPPIYIGFGSIPLKKPDRLYKALSKVLEETDERLIYASPWAEQACPIDHERLLKIEGAPHNLLFEKTAGVIHHGGAGTMSAALYAGVPQYLYPYNADQPFWSRQLFDKKLITRPTPLKKLSGKNLKRAVLSFREEALRKRVEEFQKIVGKERGCERAVELLEESLNP